MKIIKWILRFIIIIPFIIGVPNGFKFMEGEPTIESMTGYQGVITFCGVLTCYIIIIAIFLIIFSLVFTFLHWLFSPSEEKLKTNK